MKRICLIILAVVAALLSAFQSQDGVVINNNLPAGNIVFERMVGTVEGEE